MPKPQVALPLSIHLSLDDFLYFAGGHRQSIFYYMLRSRTRTKKSSKIQQTPQLGSQNVLSCKISTFSRKEQYSQSDDIFEPEYHTMKKLRMPIKRAIKKGAWTLEENKAYLGFLQSNKASFTSEASRREERVFCRLSELLHKKRTPEQCRSHHQKLLEGESYSIDDLILKIKVKIALCQQHKLLNRKIRIFNKFRSTKLAKAQKFLKSEEPSPSQAKQEDNHQILQVVHQQFFNLTTFKNSSRILLQINEQAIPCYSLL